MDREFLRWLLLIIALLCGVVWLLTAVGSGFSGPGWVPPAGFLALALAVAMPRG